MATIAYIKILLQKASDKSITADELDVLLQWFASENATSSMSKICGEFQIDEEAVYSIVDDAKLESQWDALLEKISEQEETESIDTIEFPASRKMFWTKIAVAASVLAILSMITFWYVKQKTEVNTLTTNNKIAPAKNPITPGSNKAILITNNGQQIVLDSGVNKVLVKGDNYSIRTNEQGQLVNNSHIGKEREAVTNTVMTPSGGQYEVVLVDGTTVKLNAASSITYPSFFQKDKRTVSITGEAYFEVAHDASRPFIVSTARGMKVEVLGTHFDINSYADESSIKTTLLEGAVKVTSGSATQLLRPSQQAQLAVNGSLNLVPNVDVRRIVAWKDGLFQFDETDIKTVMREISRWYNVDVVYNGNVPKDLFSAIINRQNSIDQVLAMLQNTLRVHFLIKNRTIYVSDQNN